MERNKAAENNLFPGIFVELYTGGVVLSLIKA